MKVFVTGVAGFLGSHLADGLLAQGHDVAGIDNLIGGERENVPPGVNFQTIDCNDRAQLRQHMKGTEVVFHLAATAHEGLSVFSPHENARNGYLASCAVFSAAAACGIRRMVNCSSMARYGRLHPPFSEDMTPRPCDPYGVGKLAAEDTLRILAEEHGFEWVTLVPHNIYGRRQAVDPYRNVATIFANLMLQGRQPCIYGDGHQERCFSYVSDCVDPIIRAGVNTSVVGEVVNIGPDHGVVTVLQLAEIIARILDFPLEPVFLPARPCEVKLAHCSADKARGLLDYEPRVSLEDGLRDMIAWMRERGPRDFDYRLGIEIESDRVPRTWRERLF